MNTDRRRRGLLGRRLLLTATALTAFAGSANAANLTATWTAPTAGSAAPGTTQAWTLAVTADAPSNGPASFNVGFTLDAGSHTSDPIGLGPLATTPAAGGSMSCIPTGMHVTCSDVRFTGAGTHTLSIPVVLPRNYVPTVSAAFTAGPTPGDIWSAPPAPKTITVESGQSNLYGGGPMPDATNDHVASGATLEIPFSVFNMSPGAAEHVRIRVNTSANLPIVGITGATVVSGLGTGDVEIDLGTVGANAGANFGVVVKGGAPSQFNVVNASVRSTGDGMSDGPLRAFGPSPIHMVQVTDGTTARVRMMQIDGTEWLPGPGTFTQVVAIRNEGPDPLSVSDRLAIGHMADGTITAAQTSSGGGCAPDGAVVPGSWSCDIGTRIPAGKTVTVTVSGTVDTSQTVVATDFRLMSNSYTGMSGIFGSSLYAVTNVDPNHADVQLTASHAATAPPGTVTPVTLTVRNGGTITATGVTVRGRLLANATLTSASPQCVAGRVFDCELGDIPAGGSASVTLNVVGSPLGSRATFTATASTQSPEFLLDDNSVLSGFDVANPPAPAPPPPAPTPPPPAPTAPPPAPAPPALPRTVGATVTPFPLTRIATAIRSGVPATVRADRRGTALVRVYIPVTTARTVFRMRTARAPVLIATGRRAVAANTRVTVRAILTPAWKKRLAGRRTALVLQQRIDVSATGSVTRTIRRGIRLR